MNAEAAALARPQSRRRAPSLASRYINILGPLVMIMLLCLVMVIVEPNCWSASPAARRTAW